MPPMSKKELNRALDLLKEARTILSAHLHESVDAAPIGQGDFRDPSSAIDHIETAAGHIRRITDFLTEPTRDYRSDIRC